MHFEQFTILSSPNIKLTSKILKDGSQVDRSSHPYTIFWQASLDVAQHAPHREDDPGLGGPGGLGGLLLSSSAGHGAETATSVKLCRGTSTKIHLTNLSRTDFIHHNFVLVKVTQYPKFVGNKQFLLMCCTSSRVLLPTKQLQELTVHLWPNILHILTGVPLTKNNQLFTSPVRGFQVVVDWCKWKRILY